MKSANLRFQTFLLFQIGSPHRQRHCSPHGAVGDAIFTHTNLCDADKRKTFVPTRRLRAAGIPEMIEAVKPWHQPLLRQLYASSVRQACCEFWSPCSAGELSDQRREPDLVAESHKSDMTGCELDATYPDIVLNVADALLASHGRPAQLDTARTSLPIQHGQQEREETPSLFQAAVQAAVRGPCHIQVPVALLQTSEQQ